MTGPHRRLLAPMRAHAADEPHRSSTPLEPLEVLAVVLVGLVVAGRARGVTLRGSGIDGRDTGAA